MMNLLVSARKGVRARRFPPAIISFLPLSYLHLIVVVVLPVAEFAEKEEEAHLSSFFFDLGFGDLTLLGFGVRLD